ncbi:MAG: hypothetical protein R3B70_24620 [Polyangiaceae bacterium]
MAIRGALSPRSRNVDLKEAQKLLAHMENDEAKLDRGESVRLQPYCFAIRQALLRQIPKLKGIKESRRASGG